MITDFKVSTQGQGLYEFTDDIRRWLAGQRDGLLTLMVQHTSASLLIQENADPDVQRDLLAFFQRRVPPSTDPSMAFLRHTAEGPDDMPAHIKAAVLPSLSAQIPSARMINTAMRSEFCMRKCGFQTA